MTEKIYNLKLVPITKIILCFCVSFVAIISKNINDLLVLSLAEILVFLIGNIFFKQMKTLLIFSIFATVLAIIQLLFTNDILLAILIGLKMFSMGVIFLYLLVTTPIKDLTIALVSQMKISYKYAFMVTCALRFIPDFLAEANIVKEAQMCRGLSLEGNFIKKIKSYSFLIKPLVLRSLGKSETMALSLELRGFGSKKHKFAKNVSPRFYDLVIIFLVTLMSIIYSIKTL